MPWFQNVKIGLEMASSHDGIFDRGKDSFLSSIRKRIVQIKGEKTASLSEPYNLHLQL